MSCRVGLDGQSELACGLVRRLAIVRGSITILAMTTYELTNCEKVLPARALGSAMTSCQLLVLVCDSRFSILTSSTGCPSGA